MLSEDLEAGHTHSPLKRKTENGWETSGWWDSPCTPLLPVLIAQHSQLPRGPPAAIRREIGLG